MFAVTMLLFDGSIEKLWLEEDLREMIAGLITGDLFVRATFGSVASSGAHIALVMELCRVDRAYSILGLGAAVAEKEWYG